MDLPPTYFNLLDETPLEQKMAVKRGIKQSFALYYFESTGLMEKLLYALKYQGNKEIGHFFGRKLAAAMVATKEDYDGIIGVPLHVKRRRKRGFNQVDIIGKTAAKALGIPYYDTVLVRTKNTPPLSKVNGERSAILANAFEIKQPLPAGKHYLLLDDIFTTGATLNACASILLEETAISLSIASVAYRN